MDHSSRPAIIPVTLFSGFLGSGKTTIISHIIDDLQASGEQVAYVKNEIGEVNIDSQLLKGKLIATRELLNGCICCTLVGPFISALDDIIDTVHPTRIVIEASGAADPSAIALMISSNQRLKRDGVITIIDVVNFEGYKDLSFTAREQAKFTDLIVFNKIELADEDRKRAVVGYVRELNDTSPIVEAPEGKLRTALVFGISSLDLEKKLDTASPHIHDDHLEADHIQTFAVAMKSVTDTEKVRQIVEKLPKNILRAKGFIQTASGMAIVNKVGQRVTIEPYTGETNADPELVCIGFEIAPLQEEVTTLLHSA